MSIALFFVTHEGIASNLLSIGEAIVQKPNNNLSYLEIAMDTSIDEAINMIEKKLASLSTNEGIVFITDIYGGTPSNIAQQLADKYQTHLVSGVNLPMVIRLLNYREEQTESLLQKALDGAHLGIQDHTTPQ